MTLIGKAAVISPCPHLSQLAFELASQIDLKFIIEDGILQRGVDIAHSLKDEVDVFISRGPTGVMIRRTVEKPTVLVELAPYDILRAFFIASKQAQCIGIIDFQEQKMKYNFRQFEEMLGIEIREYFYGNMTQLEEAVAKVKRDGLEIAICTGICIVEMLENIGVKGILVYSNRKAVMEAFLTALNMVEFRKKDARERQKLQTILDSSSEGIIALGENREVKVFNPVAESYTGIDSSRILEQRVDLFKENRYIQQLFDSSSPLKGEMYQVQDKHLLVNRSSIKVEGITVGTVVTFQDVTRIQQLEQRIRKKLHRKGLVASFTFGDVITGGEVMEEKIEEAISYARCDLAVLITGESGTGKELFAQSIHNESSRKGGSFVAINCAALPENLLESELFGYEEGAFTGARKGGKAGLFELAHGGTIFLDEIGEMSPQLQARLLRVLQEKEVMRLGGDQVIPVDCRIISATNHHLKERIQRGYFREDLFYRLNVLGLHLPPLRMRTEDIPLLAQHFIAQHSSTLNKEVLWIEPRALERLKEYSWPGNIRELENYVKKGLVLLKEDVIDLRFVEELLVEKEFSFIKKERQEPVDFNNHLIIELSTFERMEKELLYKAQERLTGNRSEVAKALGISRTTLWKKLKGD